MPPIQKKWVYISVYGFKYLFIVYSVSLFTAAVLKSRTAYGDAVPKSPLYGVYTVDTFIKNKDTIPPDARERWRWKELMMESIKLGGVKHMDDVITTTEIKTDTARHQLSIIFSNNQDHPNHFTYRLPDSEHLVLKGRLDGDAVFIELTKKRFELNERGFNWIIENPYNR